MSHDLERLLSEIPRETAPEIPLGALLERLTAGRRRLAVLGSLAAAATLMLAVSTSTPAPEAPVHLRLRVVEIGPQAEDSTVRTLGQPPEFDRP